MTDYYEENGYIIFTAEYLKSRGRCCSNGCRHCPYSPDKIRHTRQIVNDNAVTPKQQELNNDSGIRHD